MSSEGSKVVEPCKGWNVSCAFCDKRFSRWIQPDDEILSGGDLAKPGLFMFTFETKQGKEIVSIGSHPIDVRTVINKNYVTFKKQVSQKKHKEAKSEILVRYLVVESVDSKDSCSLFSHWYNYGILPRLSTKWPGLEILKSTEHYQFDETCNKWCHPTKDPFWRKQKIIVGPRAIKPCKGWKSKCTFCDARFTSWIPYATAAESIPSQPGLAMFSFVDKGLREVLYVGDYNNLKKYIHDECQRINEAVRYDLKVSEPKEIEVRWLIVEDLSSENACFVYAHWLNYRVAPQFQNFRCYEKKSMPGENVLIDSEVFEFRSRDKQWCYIDEQSQKSTAASSKSKDRRNVLQSIKDDLVMNA